MQDLCALRTEVGSLLADQLQCKFYDADDYHPVENKRKMSQGIPLNDQDRFPWLCSMHELLKREKACGQHVVLACSALKKAYRKTLTTGQKPEGQCQHKEDDISSRTLFIHLQGSMELISERMQKRRGHFMPLTLLQSQFDTLEPPEAPELFMTVNVQKNVLEIVCEVKAELESKTPRHSY
ncbi:probable gluconokinase isoform X2 [Hyla sarda]|uniref:probable gluconokinase isoform X2 n=1 Tax=Hyla sarda TaxID=327740 RepID=UPI0024C43F8A|nr:probable gluconokinase isoform X2 [Hyla sarda]